MRSCTRISSVKSHRTTCACGSLQPVKDFGHAFIARLTQLDYARAMAFAAISESTGQLLGVVRLHSDANYETGEYAILLRSDLKGHGLGWKLMELMIEYARAEGLRRIDGQVLCGNVGDAEDVSRARLHRDRGKQRSEHF